MHRIHTKDGAALVVALGVFALLLFLGITALRASREEVRIATNQQNAIRAELIASGGASVAMAFINQDAILRPTYSSLDHAWRTYFNGAFAVGKSWMWKDGRPLIQGGAPEIPFTPEYEFETANRIPYGPETVDQFYIPRLELPRGTLDGPVLDPQRYLDEPALHAFVTSADFGLSPGLSALADLGVYAGPLELSTPAQQVHQWADVDLTGDGLRDAIWLPMGADRVTDNNGLDSNLNGIVDDPGETSLFLYLDPETGLPRLTTPLFFHHDNDLNTLPLVLEPLTVEWNDAGVSRTITLDPAPGGDHDFIDNNFDLVVNSAKTYFVRFLMNTNLDELPPGIAAAERQARAAAGLQGFDDPAAPALPEIAPRYLRRLTDPRAGEFNAANPPRVFSTGEPVSDLVGRFAVHVTDEASKVNINVAGAHSRNPYFGVVDGTVLVDQGEPDGPIRRAINLGVGPHEYETLVLPQVFTARSVRMWTYRTGAPEGGLAFVPWTTAYDAVTDDSVSVNDGLLPNPDDAFNYDVSFPGYGRVDNTGAALWLAMDGIDNSGTGLIDEGLRVPRLPQDPTPAQLAEYNVYLAQLGLFEGVDEPGSYRLFSPHRHYIAESDGVDNDGDGSIDEIGELGDRYFRDREQLKLVRDFGGGGANYEALRNLITAHSGEKNLRYGLFDYFTPDHPEAEAAGREASFARAIDGPERFPRPTGLKFDPNLTPAERIAQGLAEGWGLGPMLFADPPDNVTPGGARTPALIGGFARGLRSESLSYLTRDPVTKAPLRRGVLPVGTRGTVQDDYTNLGGVELGKFGMPADPELAAYQLALNVRDFADLDHSRTTATNVIEDSWLREVQIEAMESAGIDPNIAEQTAELRAIEYTQAGVDSIRINELMVRPVRRVEAEFWVPADGDLDTNGNRNFYANLLGMHAPIGENDFNLDRNILSVALGGPSAWDRFGGSLSEHSFRFTEVSTFTATGASGSGLMPNMVEFAFRPSPMLPPGRYYLLFNTRGENVDVRVSHADQMRFIIKRATPADSTSIIEDIILRMADPINLPDDWVAGWMERRPLVYPEGAGPQNRGDAINEMGTVWLRNDFDDTIPEPSYQGDTAAAVELREGETLYVAVWSPTAGTGVNRFAANYFDFSQEPDHEYIELVNIAEGGDPIDISGWQLEVNASESPGRKLFTIPGQLGSRNVQIAPGGKLLLGFNKFPVDPTIPEAAVVELPYKNGIGLTNAALVSLNPKIGARNDLMAPPIPNPYIPIAVPDPTMADETFSVFRRPANGPDSVDFVDMNGNGLRDEVTGAPLRSADFSVESTPVDPAGFEGTAHGATKTFDRIVQLKAPELERVGQSYEAFGRILLEGGMLPNYPERDGYDNDMDRDLITRDGVDHKGTVLAAVLEIRLGLPPGTLHPNPDNDGIDEGRFWVEYRNLIRRPPDTGPGYGVPGSFDGNPVFYHGVFRGSATSDIHFTFDPLGTPDAFPQNGDWFVLFPYPLYFGYARDPGTGFNRTPPEWTNFIERRWYPGDVVYVTLYEGAAHEGRIADQVSYTEWDVINRSVDDIVPASSLIHGATYEPLDPRFPSFWPENHMFFDFYKSLERKHPLHSGNRFGRANRWTATDGAYDDWAPAMSVFERITTGTGAVVLNGAGEPAWGNRLNPVYVGAANLRKYAHALNGSPLRPNYARRLIENFHDVTNDDLQFAIDQTSGSEDLAFTEMKRWGFERARVRNRTLASPGDLMTLPYFRDTIDMRPVVTDPAEFRRNYLSAGAQVNRAMRTGSPVLDTRKHHPDGALVSHHFFDSDPHGGLATFEPERLINAQTAVVSSMDTGKLMLTAAQARYWNLSMHRDDESAITEGDTVWQPVTNELPRTWAPVALFTTDADDDVNPERDLRVQANIENRALLSADFLFRVGNPLQVTTPGQREDYARRWPPGQRAIMYVSGNYPDFNPSSTNVNLDDRSRRMVPFTAEGFFEWDASAGLANGEYEVYVAVADDLTMVRQAANAAAAAADRGDFPVAARTMLTDVGGELVRHARQTPNRNVVVDIEFFTDRDGDRRFFIDGYNPDTLDITPGAIDGIPRTHELDRGLPNQAAFPEDPGDSLGFRAGLRPGADGLIYYGLVRVENNRLGMFIRNWSEHGTLVRFSRVILAPRNTAAGRLNVNTVETVRARTTPGAGDPPLHAFNPLVGVPGILTHKELDDAGNILRDAAGNVVYGLPSVPLLEYLLPPLTQLAGLTDAELNPTVDVGVRSPAGNLNFAVQRARRVAEGRRPHADGRYYRFAAEVAEPAPVRGRNYAHFYPDFAVFGDGTAVLSNVTTDLENPVLRAGARANQFDETRFRFSRSANLLNSRSGVYEIVVRAQTGSLPGSAPDENYRTDFLVTGERQLRIVYAP